MDVTAALASFTDGGAAAVLIGGAALVLAIGIKVYKRLRGAA